MTAPHDGAVGDARKRREEPDRQLNGRACAWCDDPATGWAPPSDFPACPEHLRIALKLQRDVDESRARLDEIEAEAGAVPTLRDLLGVIVETPDDIQQWETPNGLEEIEVVRVDRLRALLQEAP